MKGSNRLKLLSIFLVFAYLLSACSGAGPQSTDQTSVGGGKPQALEVSFTGTVEALSTGAITVSGQTVSLDGKSVMDPNIKVGDIVKVEAQVSESGAVLALKVESFGADDTNTNASNTNNDTNVNSNTNDNSNASNDNTNANANGNDNTNTTTGVEQEISGVVDAVTADSITVGGVVYKFATSTEFKDAIFAGDTVKLHVVVNADGTFTVREIEKTAGASLGNDNSNGNDDNGNDDNSNGNDDDHEDDNSNSSGNGNGHG